jgi:formate hydrogenlyase subunit 3/multisubunit Na+/H+ antiporter MnhD subunit
MNKIRKAIEVIFVLTLAVLLAGGVVFVAGQATGLLFGQGSWLEFFNDTVKAPMCIAASICAIAGFLLSYKHEQEQAQTQQEATSR